MLFNAFWRFLCSRVVSFTWRSFSLHKVAAAPEARLASRIRTVCSTEFREWEWQNFGWTCWASKVAVWRSIFFVLNSHVRTVDRSWWWRCDWPGRRICRDECKPWHWYQRGDCRLQEPCLSFHDVSSFFSTFFYRVKEGAWWITRMGSFGCFGRALCRWNIMR